MIWQGKLFRAGRSKRSKRVMVSNLHITGRHPFGGSMYEAPRLVKFGRFRDLTLQSQCLTQAPWTGKTVNTADILFPQGQNDGCPDVRS